MSTSFCGVSSDGSDFDLSFDEEGVAVVVMGFPVVTLSMSFLLTILNGGTYWVLVSGSAGSVDVAVVVGAAGVVVSGILHPEQAANPDGFAVVSDLAVVIILKGCGVVDVVVVVVAAVVVVGALVVGGGAVGPSL